MRTLLPITLTTLLMAATAVSAQAQTDPTNPDVVAPDGVCTRIPNPADLNGPHIPDETDPDCHEAGLIYQEVPDTHIDARVDTTATDWATACRTLGMTVGPLAKGHGGPEPHTFETATYVAAAKAHTGRRIKQAVIAPSAISLIYPQDGIEGYSRDAFLADLMNECEKDIRSAFDAGADSVQIDFTEGRLCCKLDPSRGLLRDFVALNNQVLACFAGPASADGPSSNRMRVESKFGVLGRSDGGHAGFTPSDRRPPFVLRRPQARCRRPGRRSPGFPAQ